MPLIQRTKIHDGKASRKLNNIRYNTISVADLLFYPNQSSLRICKCILIIMHMVHIMLCFNLEISWSISPISVRGDTITKYPLTYTCGLFEITCTNADMLFIKPKQTNLDESENKILLYHFRKIYLKCILKMDTIKSIQELIKITPIIVLAR